MAILSALINTAGLALFVHAAYSSYEHSLLTTSTATPTSIPTDIVVEALFSTVLLIFGVVLGSPDLRPIEWAAWAGEMEKDVRRPKGKKRFEGDGGAEGGGMGFLEDRKGFADIRTQRKEFADWVREGGKKE